jgi:hypothetical protein
MSNFLYTRFGMTRITPDGWYVWNSGSWRRVQ